MARIPSKDLEHSLSFAWSLDMPDGEVIDGAVGRLTSR